MEQKIVTRLRRINKILDLGEICDMVQIQKDWRDNDKSPGLADRNMKIL